MAWSSVRPSACLWPPLTRVASWPKFPESARLWLGLATGRSFVSDEVNPPYIESDSPVTVTRHGQAVGLFVPLRRPSAEDLQRLRATTANFRKAVPRTGDDVEELVADFDALRHGRPLPSRPVPVSSHEPMRAPGLARIGQRDPHDGQVLACAEVCA